MIEINNLTKITVDKKFLTGVAKIVLKGENKGKSELSIALVSPAEIKKLNKQYRRKNQPTDVLAFGQNEGVKRLHNYVARSENESKLSFSSLACNYKKFFELELGEVVICPAVVRKNAKKYETSFKKELARVLIHGILHILEYDHKKSKKDAELMEKKEEYYLSKFYNF